MFRKLHWAVATALVIGALGLTSCGEDEPTGPTPEDQAAEICARDLCLTSPALFDECVETTTFCINQNPSGDIEECVAGAELICGAENRI